MKNIILVLCILSSVLIAQPITWTEITGEYDMPDGVTVFKGERDSPKLKIWYVKADLDNKDIAVRPYIGANKSVQNFSASTGAYAAINGGFFGGSVSYSAVVYPGEVKAQNVPAVTRNSESYPVIRSFFGMKEDRSFTVDWIYHFGNGVDDIYKFSEPLDYTYNDPAPRTAPVKENGTPAENLLTGIGGGPVLIKNGEIDITYNEEIFWGSGVGYDNRDPRTAVGYTADNEVIFITADGRQIGSEGVGLPELAEILKGLGCVEAMNLDGGGSSQMAAGSEYINSPSENRAVPSILAIVHTDSLHLPKEPVFEQIIDTGDSVAVETGDGWFESANAGYWAETKAILHPAGDGESYYTFYPSLPAAEYEVYGWWVAAGNRCTDTPFIINHENGTDTLYVDQTANGSSWQKLGVYNFSGENGFVRVTDGGENGAYVVADAVRFVTYDTSAVSSVGTEPAVPGSFALSPNYPNPFNPVTNISYTVGSASEVEITVYDPLGNKIETLVSGHKPAGTYTVSFDAGNLSSGIYLCRMSAGRFSQTGKLVLLK